ncbi:glycosyltransferase family 9 protein [Holophaga foetida]|uniref:glycosyltransferase family 9 protein n=1 Tax=Holophaga foetida TaxID=35839 RepID=UPI000247214E|nr:glycosyltransferase family 9 protein [Holophaga foetida]
MPKKILVIRLSAIGDVVRTVPSVLALRGIFPQATIHWLVEDRCAEIITGLEGVDALKIAPRRAWNKLKGLARFRAMLAFGRELKAEGYDLVVDFHGVAKSAFLAFLTRSPRRVGYPKGIAKEGSHIFLTERVPLVAGKLSRYDRNFLLPRYFDPAVTEPEPTLPIGEGDRSMAQGFLAEHGLVPKGYAFLYPGTSKVGAYKRWPAESFGRVADLVWERFGVPAVIGWGPGEEEMVERLVKVARHPIHVLPLTSMKEMAAVLEQARIYIGGDTGPLHIASLVHTPALAIYGPSDPVLNEPWRKTPFRIVRTGIGCSPCRNRKCDHLSCLRLLEPLRVAEEAGLLLGKV